LLVGIEFSGRIVQRLAELLAVLDGQAELDLGVPPPQPAWGLMLSDGKQGLMVGYWWLTVFPGGCIVLMVLSANILGDWLRVKLDPQLRQL